ncbi:hypothetical protein A628_04097 [Salmonella enterica subsp. enterica serovar Cubana str. 76814]|uniref:Uncharacterized protein n=1 Tax=Salmonella enterica subsp. enterica serovar Cubana str. 76814 TaxID=1192560 RepID=V7IL17_SALET|nr:hypothetical protein A628_04097 [Salmonella enterica subsp. enterica serovar Cubana str. 76814]
MIASSLNEPFSVHLPSCFSKNSFMNAPKTSYANSLLLFPSRQHRDYVKKQRADIEKYWK